MLFAMVNVFWKSWWHKFYRVSIYKVLISSFYGIPLGIAGFGIIPQSLITTALRGRFHVLRPLDARSSPNNSANSLN